MYNPVSVNIFSIQKFQNYWFATGAPTFLVNLLKEQGIYDVGAQHRALGGGGDERVAR